MPVQEESQELSLYPWLTSIPFVVHGNFSHATQRGQEPEYALGALIAAQSPLASHSTLNGFLFQNWMSRVPCHQRQVAHFLSVRLTFCIVTLPSFPQPFLRLRRAGKEKRAFDALRLRHRQAPWEEGKPKARKGAFPRALLPVFELGGFQTEERLEQIIQSNLTIQLQLLYHKLQIARPTALSACQNGRPFIPYSQLNREICREKRGKRKRANRPTIQLINRSTDKLTN